MSNILITQRGGRSKQEPAKGRIQLAVRDEGPVKDGSRYGIIKLTDEQFAGRPFLVVDRFDKVGDDPDLPADIEAFGVVQTTATREEAERYIADVEALA